MEFSLSKLHLPSQKTALGTQLYTSRHCDKRNLGGCQINETASFGSSIHLLSPLEKKRTTIFVWH